MTETERREEVRRRILESSVEEVWTVMRETTSMPLRQTMLPQTSSVE